METMYILFLGYGIGELVKYLQVKGYIKTTKAGVLITSLLIVLIQVLGNPGYLTNGNPINILFTSIASVLILSVFIGLITVVAKRLSSIKGA